MILGAIDELAVYLFALQIVGGERNRFCSPSLVQEGKVRVRQILVTYFNRRYNDRHYSKALDPDWLAHRWELFETFTVPSIVAQTCTDFDWVILFHRQSPPWLYDLAHSLDAPCRLRVSFDVLDPAFQELDAGLADLRARSYDAILTLNLDSDDALHRTALERFRLGFEADRMGHEILLLETGYRYDRLSRRLEFIQMDASPFLAKVNLPPFTNPLDMGGCHSHVIDQYRCCDISHGDPLFAQVIHQNNVLNRISSRPSFLSKSLSQHVLREAFNVEDPGQRLSVRCYTTKLEQQTRPVRRKAQRVVRRFLPRLLHKDASV